MDNEKLCKRDSSLDIIRIFAFICVLSVHFFLNIGLYDTTIEGKSIYIMILMRTFFMCCVPLFMILSGYLLNKKVLNKQYYFKLFNFYSIYLLASIVCIIYRAFIEDITFLESIKSILAFDAAPYSWYIEMYFGLFLIVPFLNIIYNGLKNKKQKTFLVIIMLSLTTIPNFLNYKIQIIPEWWTSLYPITYYYLGAYLSEFNPKFKNRYLFILLIIHILISGSFIYKIVYGDTFSYHAWDRWYSLTNLITSLLVFMIIKNINTLNWNIKIKKILIYIGKLSLCGYLVSWIFDNLFYKILNNNVEFIYQRILYFIPMVLLVLICSLLLSSVINFINDYIYKLIIIIKNKDNNKEITK